MATKPRCRVACKCTQKSRAALKAASVVDWDEIVLSLSRCFVLCARIKTNKEIKLWKEFNFAAFFLSNLKLLLLYFVKCKISCPMAKIN